MDAEGRRRRSTKVARAGGVVDPTDIQLTPSQKLLYTEIIPNSNPVTSLIKGFDNILQHRISQVLNVYEIPGEADPLGRYTVYKIEMTRWTEAKVQTSYQASQNKQTIATDIYARIYRYWQDANGHRIIENGVPLIEYDNEFHLTSIPVMRGSIADPIKNRRERYEKGDEPLLPDGYFTIDGTKQYIVLYNKLKFDMPITYLKTDGVMTSVICTTPDMSTVQIIINNTPDQVLQCRTTVLGNVIEESGKKSKLKMRFISLYDYLAILMTKKEKIKLNGEDVEVDVDPSDEEITNLILEYVPEEHLDLCRDTLYLSEGHRPKKAILESLRAEIRLAEKVSDLERRIVEEIYPAIPYHERGLKAKQLAYVGSRHLLYMVNVYKPHDRDSPSLYRMDTPEIVITKLFADKLRAAVDIIRVKGKGETGIRDIKGSTEVQKLLQKSNVSIKELYRPIASVNLVNKLSKLREEVILAFKKGNFGGKNIKRPTQNFRPGASSVQQKGIIARLETNSYSQAWSCITKRAIGSSSKGKSIKVRSGHPGRAGYEDLYKSPDNEMIGLVMFLASTAYMSTWIEATPVVVAIGPLPQAKSSTDPDLILVNGIIQGYADGRKLVNRLNGLRENNGVLAPFFDSMFFYDAHRREVQILTDAGRWTRPLLTVERDQLIIDKKKLSWTSSMKELMMMGALRYVDSYEAEYGGQAAQFPQYFHLRWNEVNKVEEVLTRLKDNIKLAKSGNLVVGVDIDRLLATLRGYRVAYKRGVVPEDIPREVTKDEIYRQIQLLEEYSLRASSLLKYNYCEIDADVILGFSSGIVPFMNRTSGTKQAYAGHMSTQAVGQGSSNTVLGTAPLLRELDNGQRGMTETGMGNIVGINTLPASQNATVAIMPGTTYGDYGGGTQEDAIQVKESAVARGLCNYTIHKQLTYSAPATSGIAVRSSRPKGEFYSEAYSNLDTRGVVLVGSEVKEGDVIFSLEQQSAGGKWNRKDTVTRPGEKGIVTDVYYTENPLYIQICLSESRKPVPGTKLSSMYANKGVIVEVTPDDQMPIDVVTGMSPDVIFNPLGLHSRGTVGLTIEMITGMASSLLGQRTNASGMSQEFKVSEPSKVLAMAGFNPKGEFKLLDRRSGEFYPGTVAMGIFQIQLINMTIEESVNWAGQVARHPWNMQPVKGKKKGGGIRMGVNEYDALAYHGMEAMRRSVYYRASDGIKVPACRECGRFATASHKVGQYECTYCASQLPTDELHKARNIAQIEIAGSWRHIQQTLLMRGIEITHILEK
jgi:DNA-directed RNA polymerase beta subunit